MTPEQTQTMSAVMHAILPETSQLLKTETGIELRLIVFVVGGDETALFANLPPHLIDSTVLGYLENKATLRPLGAAGPMQ